jgi:hypothetical protein
MTSDSLFRRCYGGIFKERLRSRLQGRRYSGRFPAHAESAQALRPWVVEIDMVMSPSVRRRDPAQAVGGGECA